MNLDELLHPDPLMFCTQHILAIFYPPLKCRRLLMLHSCHILPFQPMLWNKYFPPEPAKTAKNSPRSISEGGRIWQVWLPHPDPLMFCTQHQQSFTLLDLCVSSLRGGHANILCIVPILTDGSRRESGSADVLLRFSRTAFFCLQARIHGRQRENLTGPPGSRRKGRRKSGGENCNNSASETTNGKIVIWVHWHSSRVGPGGIFQGSKFDGAYQVWLMLLQNIQ